jgi:hypothetical protein
MIGGARDLRRGLASLVEELELFDWYVREAARTRDESLRKVLGEHLRDVREAIRRALDAMRSGLGREP